MSDNKNENENRKVPTVSFEDFLKHESGECKIKGPFKVQESDKSRLLEYLKNR